MWEQCQVLGDVADSSMLDWEIYFLGWVEEHAICDCNFACVGNGQARDAIEERGLPCSGRAEEDCDSGGYGELNVQGEVWSGSGEVLFELNGQGRFGFVRFHLARLEKVGPRRLKPHRLKLDRLKPHRLEPQRTLRFTKECVRLVTSMAIVLPSFG